MIHPIFTVFFLNTTAASHTFLESYYYPVIYYNNLKTSTPTAYFRPLKETKYYILKRTFSL